MPQPAFHFFAIRTVELHPFQLRRNRRFLVLRTHVETHQVLRRLRRVSLREMHEIHRCTFLREHFRHAFRQRRLRILETQRHRPPVAPHREARRARHPRQFTLKKFRRAQRRRHQQKPRARQRKQRHLPRRPALRVRVVVKFVHDHRLHRRRPRPAAERDIGQDLRRAAQHGRVEIHARIARHHADVFRPEIPAQRQELFVHQRLDRARVNRPLARAQRLEMQRGGHE